MEVLRLPYALSAPGSFTQIRPLGLAREKEGGEGRVIELWLDLKYQMGQNSSLWWLFLVVATAAEPEPTIYAQNLVDDISCGARNEDAPKSAELTDGALDTVANHFTIVSSERSGPVWETILTGPFSNCRVF